MICYLCNNQVYSILTLYEFIKDKFEIKNDFEQITMLSIITGFLAVKSHIEFVDDEFNTKIVIQRINIKLKQ